ncbi:MAG: hypothetical protein QW595_02795 [Candidatus Bathyarchaeia archaeon]
MKIQSHVCPNPICRKTFTKPVKVENLSSGTLTVYEACPYCLTEITLKEAITPVKQKATTAENVEAIKLEHETKKEETVNVQPSSLVETPNCKHYFGYLSERSSRDMPPEECMVCPKIVQCMLRSVTG